jgi:hypothetical protein
MPHHSLKKSDSLVHFAAILYNYLKRHMEQFFRLQTVLALEPCKTAPYTYDGAPTPGYYVPRTEYNVSGILTCNTVDWIAQCTVE